MVIASPAATGSVRAITSGTVAPSASSTALTRKSLSPLRRSASVTASTPPAAGQQPGVAQEAAVTAAEDRLGHRQHAEYGPRHRRPLPRDEDPPSRGHRGAPGGAGFPAHAAIVAATPAAGITLTRGSPSPVRGMAPPAVTAARETRTARRRDDLIGSSQYRRGHDYCPQDRRPRRGRGGHDRGTRPAQTLRAHARRGRSVVHGPARARHRLRRP